MKPITRRETLLNQIADNTSGNAGSIDMEPITREEVYLKQIADNTASGGGGGGGSAPIVYCPATTTDSETGRPTKLGMTWQEIHDAISAGKIVFVNTLVETAGNAINVAATYIISEACYVTNSEKYNIGYADLTEDYAYIEWLHADTANDYPES